MQISNRTWCDVDLNQEEPKPQQLKATCFSFAMTLSFLPERLDLRNLPTQFLVNGAKPLVNYTFYLQLLIISFFSPFFLASVLCLPLNEKTTSEHCKNLTQKNENVILPFNRIDWEPQGLKIFKGTLLCITCSLLYSLADAFIQCKFFRTLRCSGV